MRARDLAVPSPTVAMDNPALEAVRLLAGQTPPGLIAMTPGPADDGAAGHAVADRDPDLLPERPWPQEGVPT